MEGRTHWAAVIAAIGAGIVAAAHIGKVPPALPALRQALDLSLVQAGWVVSAFNTLGVASAVVFGVLCDRVGHLRFAYTGLAALIAGGLLGALADGPALLLFSRFLEGVGFLSVAVAAPALIVAASRQRDRNLTLGLWSTYMPAGTGAAMLFAPLALGAFGWRGLWALIALVTCLCAFAVWRLNRDFVAPAKAAAPTLKSILQALKLPGPWSLSIVMGAYAAQWVSLMVWLPSFLMESRRASGLMAASLTALVVVANIPGNLLGGWFVHRVGSRGVMISVISAIMGMCSMGIFHDGFPDVLRYLLCIVFSCVGGMIPAAVLSGVPAYARVPTQVGTLNGLVVQVSHLGQFIGPPTVAAAVAVSGQWRAALQVLLAAAGIAILAGFAVTLCERSAAHRPR